MGKQWVRQEIKRNELADRFESVATTVQANRQTALIVAVAVLALLVVGGFTWAHLSKARNEAWEKLAIAESLAYQNQTKTAQEQLLPVIAGRSAPAAYAQLFAGDLHFKNGQYKEAAAAYQKLVDRQGPKTVLPIAMADLGLALEASGDSAGAIEAIQRYLDRYQEHFMAPQAQAAMVRCYLALGKPEQAKETLNRIVLLYQDTYWAQWAKERLNPTKPAPVPPPAPAKAAAPAPAPPAPAAPPAATP